MDAKDVCISSFAFSPFWSASCSAPICPHYLKCFPFRQTHLCTLRSRWKNTTNTQSPPRCTKSSYECDNICHHSDVNTLLAELPLGLPCSGPRKIKCSILFSFQDHLHAFPQYPWQLCRQYPRHATQLSSGYLISRCRARVRRPFLEADREEIPLGLWVRGPLF